MGELRFGLSEGSCPGHSGGCRRHLMHCTRMGCYWRRGEGVLQVSGAFVQYAHPLASGSRPSCSRPAWGGPVTEAPGSTKNPANSLPRGPVSTALTLTIQPSKHPVGIVGILRLIFGVRRRCAFDVSTMDTSDPPRPARPLLSANHPLQDHQPAPASRPSERLRSHDTHPPCPDWRVRGLARVFGG